MALSKSDLEEPQNIDNYRSLVIQLMWYTNKVGHDMSDEEIELSAHMSHTGTEHWKVLRCMIGCKKVKEKK